MAWRPKGVWHLKCRILPASENGYTNHMNRSVSWLLRLLGAIGSAYRENPKIFLLRLTYLLALAYVLVFWRAIWTPDLLFFMFLGLFFMYGLGRQFLVQFGPFVLLQSLLYFGA